MTLLLDTHIALWWVLGDPRLSSRAKSIITAQDGPVWVSAVSIWEVAIKHPLQRGAPDDLCFAGRDALALFEEAGFTLLAVAPRHAAAVDDLPAIHADPFDRLMIAQARVEPMHFLTADTRLAAYGAPVMLV